MKKCSSKVLAMAMAVAMMVPGMNVMAAEVSSSATGNSATDSTNCQTTVKYDVNTSYTWSVPSEIDFTNASDATVTTSSNDSDTKTQNVKVTQNVIPADKKLQIALGNDNTFKVTSSEKATLDYKVSKVVENNADSELAKGGTVLDVAAGINSGSATLKFVLTKDNVEKAGNYTGTVTYTASVVENK